MIQRETNIPESERVNAIIVASPTGSHYSIVLTALENGFHVICETPLCFSEEEAFKLAHVAIEKNLICAISHPYCYYGMVRYARDLIANNAIGEVISIRASYLQNAGILEKDASSWRFVTSQGGISYCFSDLGVQAYQLIAFVTQLTPTRVSGCLSRAYANRATDDNGCALLQMKEGVFCDLHASKTSLLHDNFLSIEVDGTTGAIHWDLDAPNQLIYQRIHMNKQVLTPDSPPVMDHLRGRYSRLPRGHAEVGVGRENEA